MKKFFLGIFIVIFCSACRTNELSVNEQIDVLPSPMLKEYFYDELKPYQQKVGETYNHKNKLWWHTFASGDLNRLQRIALQENFDILASYARLKQYAASAHIAETDYFPLLDAKGSIGVNDSETKVSRFDVVTSNSSDKNRLSFSASYEVDVWGRVRSAYNAEKMRFVASRDDLHTAAMTISAKVASTWAELLGNNAEIKIVKDQIEVNESLVKLQKVRFSNSLVSSLDVLQQEEVLASSKAELPELLQKSVELKNSLSVLLGQLPGNLPKFTEDAPLPIVLAIPDAGLPVELLMFRPDIRSAWARVQATHFDVVKVNALRFPSLKLSMSHVFDSADLSLLFSNWSNDILASLAYTIFDAGKKKYDYQKMKAVAEEALVNYSKTVAIAISEVNNAMAKEYAQQEKLRLLEKQYVMAKSATRGALNAYLEGSEDILRFLSLLQSTQNLERTIAKQRVNVVQVRINLYKSLGNMYFPEEQMNLFVQKEEINVK